MYPQKYKGKWIQQVWPVQSPLDKGEPLYDGDRPPGDIQHTCESLSEAHTADHHRWWRLIHGELSRLVSTKWRFMCITGEKNLETIWTELTDEFKDLHRLQWLNITKDSIWNAERDREMSRPLTRDELKLTKKDQSRETITQTRFWWLRPDGISFRPPTETKTVVFCILEFSAQRYNTKDDK